MDGMRGLDAYITGGRFSTALIWVTCPDCEEKTLVKTETEYGATDWDPAECETEGCGRDFTGDEVQEDAEPEPPDYDPHWDEPDDRDEW